MSSYGYHAYKTRRDTLFSLIGLDDEPSFFNIQPDEAFTKSYDIFTKREREILKCIVEGKSSKEIAEELFSKSAYCKYAQENILAKATVKTPVELINKAIKEVVDIKKNT